MNRPTPNPSQEGSKRASASGPFPSWEGLGVGSWSQCMRKSEWRLSMNLQVSSPVKSSSSRPPSIHRPQLEVFSQLFLLLADQGRLLLNIDERKLRRRKQVPAA